MKKRMIGAALRGRGGMSGEKDSWHLILEIGDERFSNTITSVQKDYLVIEIYEDGIRNVPHEGLKGQDH